MAKKQAKQAKRGRPPKPVDDLAEDSMRMRCTAGFKRWAEAIAEDERITLSALIDRALVEYAEKRSKPKPPRR